MLTCPVCASEDIRRSRKKNFFGFVNRWRGLQRYRCRDCGKAFYRPLLPTERPEGRDSGSARVSRSERMAARKRRQRRQIELLVFFGMLIIFYAALRVLTRSS